MYEQDTSETKMQFSKPVMKTVFSFSAILFHLAATNLISLTHANVPIAC